MPLQNMIPLALRSFPFRHAFGRVFSALFSYSPPRMAPTTWVSKRYPPTRRSDHVDVYKSLLRGEVSVPDPYEWLENDSDETELWTTAQEAFAREYLDKNPDLERLKIACQNCVDYPKVWSCAEAR